MFHEHVWWATPRFSWKLTCHSLHIFRFFVSYPEQQSCFIMMLLNICMNSNMHGCCILFHPHSKETWYMSHVSVNCLIASRPWKENTAMHSSFVTENRLHFKRWPLHDTGSVWLRLVLELDLGLVYNFPKMYLVSPTLGLTKCLTQNYKSNMLDLYTFKNYGT